MSPTFQSLSVRNYRIYAAGALVSNIGTWMGRVAQDWLVLTELTDHSSSALGLVTGLQFLPFLLLAPVSGAIADRFPKRRILLVTQTVLALTAALTTLLVLTHTAQLWMIYALALAQGLATAIDNPARQSFVSEMVGHESLANAVALNSASFNAGRLVGPGVAGVIIAVLGIWQAFAVNTLSFLFVIAALLAMDIDDLMPAPLARGRGSIVEGFRYVRQRGDLKVIFFLIFVMGTFGMNFQVTTALMATMEFHKGPTEFGMLGSIMAIGSLSAALLSARRVPTMRVFVGSLAGFTVTTAFLSLAPTYETFAILLIPTGLFALTAMTTANAMVQMSVEPVMRGRVMALYMAIFVGGTPVGAPIIGWIGQVWGPRWTIAVGTIAVALSLLVVAQHHASNNGRVLIRKQKPDPALADGSTSIEAALP